MEQLREALVEMKESLRCPICLEMMECPSSPPCGHTFCHECIVHAVTAARRPKCPLCKKKICKRSIKNCLKLALIADKVKALEMALVKDTGQLMEMSPDYFSTQVHKGPQTGTPGIQQHSKLHPTPHKPHPQS